PSCRKSGRCSRHACCRDDDRRYMRNARYGMISTVGNLITAVTGGTFSFTRRKQAGNRANSKTVCRLKQQGTEIDDAYARKRAIDSGVHRSAIRPHLLLHIRRAIAERTTVMSCMTVEAESALLQPFENRPVSDLDPYSDEALVEPWGAYAELQRLGSAA